MVSEGATHIELPGKFTFSINQSGLDYNNKQERKEAVKDFWRVWGQFLEYVRVSDYYGYLGLDYDEDDLRVGRGE